MIRSFRLRLTLWYLGLFSFLFVAFGVFLYGVLGSALRDRLDETLRSEASTAAGMFDDEMTETKGDMGASAADAAAGMQVRGSLIAVFENGRLLDASAGAPAAELAQVAQALGAAPEGKALDLARFGRYGARAAARRPQSGGGVILVAAIGPLDYITSELRLVRRALFIAMPLLLGLAGLGGYLLATRSLAPLGWMAKQAQEIGGASLNRRLEIGDAAEELTTLAASFNSLLARLDRSFETERRFVADASHELRTPLAVIRGEADVALSHERSPSAYRESLKVILDESRRLSRLVEDLLNLARADSGGVKLRTGDFYFNDLVAECCRSMQALAAERGVELHCAASGDAPFNGDEELLRRMMMNLLDNAIRYTPAGGKVAAEMALNDSGIEIRVSDTGIGIPAEAAPHVFERFYRADDARSRRDGGFGLGLSIVKWIAEAHHGKVQVASRPGHGSEFTVLLPPPR